MASYMSKVRDCYPPEITINTLTGAVPIYNQNLTEMGKDNLQEEMVLDEGRKTYNILNFQDFVQNESKKGKHETKKCRPIKNREEFVEDMGEEDDIIDPNDNPERYVKIREQFIKDELQ